MDKNTDNGTALVTGAARRIGREIALYLAKSGYRVAIHYRNSKQEARTLKNQIAAMGGKAGLFFCDLAKPRQAEKLIAKVCQKFPDLNLLVNNASEFKPSQWKSLNLEQLKSDLNTNLLAPIILTRDFARACSSGHVINIVETHITQSQSRHAAYLLSKKSLAEFTKMAAVEFSPKLRVNAIAPGLILAPIKKPKSYLQRLSKNVPLKKTGNTQNITQSIAFLLNNDYVNGQILFNDGGEHLL